MNRPLSHFKEPNINYWIYFASIFILIFDPELIWYLLFLEVNMSPIKYFTHVRLQEDLRSLRYYMVQYAERYGIKPAARVFNTTPKTVKKWLRRKEKISSDWMVDQRELSRPRRSRISENARRQAIELKRKHKSWGAMKIKKEYKLKISDKAMRKIWKEEGLM